MGNCYSSAPNSPNPQIITGSHELKIMNYSLTKGIGIGNYILSRAFDIAGYDWVIKYYPDGYLAENGNSDYISLFISIQTENINEVKATFDFTLVGKNAKSSEKTMKRCLEPKDFTPSGKTWGFDKFMKRDQMEELGFIKDDCLTIKCNVSVLVNPKKDIDSSEEPPRELIERFESLFECGEGFDVSFEVEGEIINAHKCILIASSPDFKAELSGSIKEENMRVIQIQDMKAVIFRILLHFIYTDNFPDFMKFFRENIEQEEMNALHQHLLVAADRYDVTRLRLLSELNLAKSLNEENVAHILALAGQHNCHKLREICLKYIAESKKLVDITAPSGLNLMFKRSPRIEKERKKENN